MHASILALVSLVAPDLVDPDGGRPRLGASLALEGPLLAAGAPDAGLSARLAGAVVLWSQEGARWRRVARLAGDGRAEERFGKALDLEGQRLVVGAYFADGPEPRTGAVHVFEGETPVARLVPHDAEEFDGFGWSVALDGDRLLVGAPFADRAGFQSGDARVYQRSGGNWVLQDALRPAGLMAFDHLGWSVAWSQGLALLGAPDSDLAGQDRGAVFVFEWSGTAWVERTPLVAADLPLGARLGAALCADDVRVLAGAPPSDSVRIWRRRAGAWEVEATLAGKPSSLFGAALAVRGSRLLVGAPQGAGAALSYIHGSTGWAWTGEWLGGPGSQLGTSVAVGSSGSWASGAPMGQGGCATACRGGRIEVWD